MKKQTSILITLMTAFILFTCCHSTDEKKLELELAKKDSIIESQKKIIERRKYDWYLDRILPIVVPENTKIKFGDNYFAEVHLAAFDSKEPFEIYLCETLDTINNKMYGNIDTIKMIDGVGKINIHPKHKGKNIVQGQLFFKTHRTKNDVGIHMCFRKEYYVN